MATDLKQKDLVIAAPNLQIVEFDVKGTAPYVQHRFWKKAAMMEGQQQGTTAQSKSKKAREARDFDKDYEQSKYLAKEGWSGIPAPSFRNAMISACKVAGFVMTRAKLSVFVVPDGFDANDGTPLVKITGDAPINHTAAVRNADGSADIRARPMFVEWGCKLRVRYDADQFKAADVANLLERAGLQVGIGEGRPDSKKSCGMGWGTFTIVGDQS